MTDAVDTGGMRRIISGRDWADSPLGPRERWPEPLRSAVGIMVSSEFPMFLGWGPDLTLLYNDAYVPMLGEKHPDALGTPLREVWSEIWPVIGPWAQGVLDRGEAVLQENLLLTMLRHRFPEECYFTFSYSPLVGEAGGPPAGLFCACTETTAQVIGARRMGVLRELGATPVATTMADACSSVLDVLARHRADVPFGQLYLLDADDSDAAGARLVSSFGLRDEVAALGVDGGTESVRRAAATRAPVLSTGMATRYPGSVLPGANPAGEEHPDSALVVPITTAGGDRPVAVLVAGVSPYRPLDAGYRVFFDLVAGQVATVLAGARAHEEDRRGAEALAELDRAKTEFFTSVSHELRTPLTLIQGPVAALRAAAEESGDPRRAEELEGIHRNALRLGKLVDTLLDFSRLQAGRAQALYQPVDLSARTGELAGMFHTAAQRLGLTLVVECPSLSRPVHVDPTMWEKIVLNLVSNAVKFTQCGRIEVRVDEPADRARLRVTDTGVGIPAHELPRLFERFHQVPGTGGRSAEGSGIGLSLVHELVALHGGTIEVDSEPGVGTMFTVALPLGVDHLPADRLAPAAGAPTPSPVAEPYVTEALHWAATPVGGPGDGRALARVLVVDDNADLREYLRRLLAEHHRVELAADGATALRAARADPPDLIVSDVMMPGLDGLELLAALRAQPETASVPVLLLSARAGSEASAEGLAAGADDYLTKPFEAGELIARVDAHLRLGRQRRAAEQRFRAMTDRAPAMLWVTDADGGRTFSSRAWLAFTGGGPEEALGARWQSRVHPDDLAGYRAAVAAALADRAPWELEYRLRRADGEYRWVLEHAVPVDGGADGYVGSVVEVHARHLAMRNEQRTARERLAASEEMFRLLAEHTDDVIGRHDLDGTWRYVSPSIERITGHRPDQLVGRHPREFVHPEDKDVLADALAAASDGPFGATVRFRCADGRYRWLDARGRSVTHHGSGLVELHTASRDVSDRVSAEREVHDERERFRTLVAQAPIGIFLTDRRGDAVYVNEQLCAIGGLRAEDITGRAWMRHVHPADRRQAAASWEEAVSAGQDWASEFRALRPDGTERWVSTTARALHDSDGEVTGFLGTCTDITARRETERAHREAAAEHAAQQAGETAAARLRGLVAGVAAIVWEADVQAQRFTFVSDHAEELLGYPLRRWLDDGDFWAGIIHPDDRDEVVRIGTEATAAGVDHDFSFRAATADGRLLWLQSVVHVVRDADGTSRRLQGVLVDITERKRAERAAALLAESTRLLTEPGTVEGRLAAVAGLAVGELADIASVWLRADDGRFRPVAVAPADDAPRVLAMDPITLSDEVDAAYRAGWPFVLQPLPREFGGNDCRDALIVPLVADERVVGSLSLLASPERHYDDADLTLAGDLGARVSATVAAERGATRQRRMQSITTALASADTLVQAARALVDGVAEAIGARALSIYTREPESDELRLVHSVGYPDEMIEKFVRIRPADPVPIAEVARTGEPVWLPDRAEWQARYPHLTKDRETTGNHAAAALPLSVAGRIVGVLGASFATPREFPPDEREFTLTLVGQAAQAFERAATADERRGIAETLQHSLLPSALPEVDGIALTARYLPGAHGTQAGGDWYEVIDLDSEHVALVVGDVVGQGATAAATMGQLRSALAGSLLQGLPPAEALEHLDHFAARVTGALATTVAVLVLDTTTGALRWSCAGHPPPLVVDSDGIARYLMDGRGSCLGAPNRRPFGEGWAELGPGSQVLLCTDGLFERRDESIDVGLDRLAGFAAELRSPSPERHADQVLERMLTERGRGTSDDVALVIARRVPPPLSLTLPARATELPRVRHRVRQWASTAGLDEYPAEDLVYCLDEAGANCVEHAYPADRPGIMELELRQTATGEVNARVTDHGRWRPPPADKGDRGRGLDIIAKLGDHVDISPGDTGTTVRFQITPPGDGAPAPPPPDTGAASAQPATTELHVAREPDRVHLRVVGDLDLPGAAAVREQLLDGLRAAVAASVPCSVELTPACYLNSNGIALLTEAASAAQAAGTGFELVVECASMARRVLALTGIADVVDVRPPGAP